MARPDPVRLLVLSDGFHAAHTGGIENSLRTEIPALVRRGHQLVVVARRIAPDEPAEDEWQGVPIHRYGAPPPGSRRYLAAPVATLARLPPLVRRLHAAQPFDRGYVQAAIMGLALAWSRTGIPFVHSFQAPMAPEMRIDRAAGRYGAAAPLYAVAERLANRLERAAIESADVLITRSVSMERELRAEHRGFHGPIGQVPLAVDPARFSASPARSTARAELGIQGPLVLSVRRLVARMGLDQLLEAFATVLPRHPDAVLAIAGRGYLRPRLDARVGELGIRESVRLLGFVPDDELPLWYRAADLFVLPTQALEGFGVVTVEALASGTPVLATPIGASPEILTPLGSRHLSRDASADAIAESLETWLDKLPSERERERFREYACARFGADVVAEELEEMLLSAGR